MLNARDALLSATGALPNGAAATTVGPIDLGLTARGELDFHGEFVIEAPALTTAQQPDAKTLTYAVVMSAHADLSSPVLIYDSVLVQTGAGGAGAAAASARFRLPFSPGGQGSSLRYLGVRATGSASGNSSGANVTLSVVV